ncbi:MAG: hypothetical protein KGI84_10295, partial [Elusimicrobia bacterium]|nr:hypothetical protein [Elusimicrobiota bacterium]
ATKIKQIIFQSAKVSPEEVQSVYAAAHKGSLKNFKKDKAAFASRLQETRALDLINYYLRQSAAQIEIRTYLQQRESGT